MGKEKRDHLYEAYTRIDHETRKRLNPVIRHGMKIVSGFKGEKVNHEGRAWVKRQKKTITKALSRIK